MKKLYFQTMVGICLFLITPQLIMAQPQRSHNKRCALFTRAKTDMTTMTAKSLSSPSGTSNATSYVKPRLLTLSNTDMKQETLLDYRESDTYKTVYKWNEHGHLASQMNYIYEDGKWNPTDYGVDLAPSCIYEYEYAADNTCVRQSTYAIELDGTKDIETERITAATDAEGIYHEYHYTWNKDFNKLLLSEEYGYDSFGNPVIDLYYEYADDSEQPHKHGYERRYTKKVTDENGYLFGDHYNYISMSLNYNGDGTAYGYKREQKETQNSWTLYNYDWDDEAKQFVLSKAKEYVWNDSHDRIISSKVFDAESEDSYTFTYDALKRPVKIVHTNDGKSNTSTFTYASNTVTFDFKKPVYCYDYTHSEKTNTTEDSHIIAWEAAMNAHMSTFGPVSQFTIYDRDSLSYYTTGTATFDDAFHYKQIKATTYEDGDKYASTVTYSHHPDGRVDSYESYSEKYDEKEKVTYNYNAQGRSEGQSYYYWNDEKEEWELACIEYKSYDDEDRILMYGWKDKYDDRWSGFLCTYTYDAAGNCQEKYYEPDENTGDWVANETSVDQSSDEKEEDGFLVRETELCKEYRWIRASRCPLEPVDFIRTYSISPFEDHDVYAENSYTPLFIRYTRNNPDDSWKLSVAYGTKDYWSDDNTYVMETYADRTEGNSYYLTGKITHTVDAANRLTKKVYEDFTTRAVGDMTIEYTYLDDTRYLSKMVTTNSDGTSDTTHYYYSNHNVLNAIDKTDDAPAALFTCTGRHLKAQQPMTVYTVGGECVAAGTTDITLSTPGLYIVKIASETHKVSIR